MNGYALCDHFRFAFCTGWAQRTENCSAGGAHAPEPKIDRGTDVIQSMGYSERLQDLTQAKVQAKLQVKLQAKVQVKNAFACLTVPPQAPGLTAAF